jgi:hypothetical protein
MRTYTGAAAGDGGMLIEGAVLHTHLHIHTRKHTYTHTYTGAAAGDGGMLIEGAVFVLSIAVIFCAIGTGINVYVRKRHDKQEQLARSRARGKNPSNSSYGPERLAGYVICV